MERDDRIHRQDDRAVRILGLGDNAPRGFGHILFCQRFADLYAERGKKRVRHRAADHQGLHLGDQILQQLQLGRDLRAANDRDHRPLRVIQCLAERFQLGLHGAPRISRQLVCEPFGRGMRAMRG